MAGALGRGPAPLVINLGRRHVAVAEQVLDLDAVHAGVEQKRGRGRAEGVGRVEATPDDGAVGELLVFQGAGQPFQIALINPYIAGDSSNRFASCWPPGPRRGPEEGTALQLGLGDVLGGRLRGREVQAGGSR